MTKALVLILAWCVACTLTYAQEKPQKVVSIVLEQHESAWYEKQASLWEKELKRNPRNEEGWLYLYTAQRMLWIKDRENTAAKARMDAVVKRAVKAIPGSFMANYLLGTNGLGANSDVDLFAYIKKAYDIDPTNPLTYDECVIHYERIQDLAMRREINRKWLASGTYSPVILAYNYNVLATLAPNAIIVTGGDNDTFPLWMLQDALGFHSDATVLNMSLILMPEYRKAILKKLDITLSPEEEKALDAPFQKQEDHPKFEKALVDILIKKGSAHPLYFALTLGTPHYLEPLENKLYVVGLANQYSEEKIDNIGYLRANFEKQYKLDYLTVKLHKDPAASVTPLFDQCYLTPLILLYNHYQLSGEAGRGKEVKDLLLKIARENKMEDQILPLLKS